MARRHATILCSIPRWASSWAAGSATSCFYNLLSTSRTRSTSSSCDGGIVPRASDRTTVESSIWPRKVEAAVLRIHGLCRRAAFRSACSSAGSPIS